MPSTTMTSLLRLTTAADEATRQADLWPWWASMVAVFALIAFLSTFFGPKAKP